MTPLPLLAITRGGTRLHFPLKTIRIDLFDILISWVTSPTQMHPPSSVELNDATFDVRQGMVCRQGIKAVSLRSRNYPKRWMRHQFSRIKFDEIDLSGSQASELFASDASFEIVPGLAGQCISFRSVNYPDSYIRHRNFELWLDVPDGTELFRRDATFCMQPPRAGYYPTTTPDTPPPPPPPTPSVVRCADDCANCRRDNLQCISNSECYNKNYLTPWACY